MRLLLAALLSVVPAAPAADGVAGCPQAAAHIEVATYEGTIVYAMCASSIRYIGGILEAKLYDPTADGIFHNGFDP